MRENSEILEEIYRNPNFKKTVKGSLITNDDDLYREMVSILAEIIMKMDNAKLNNLYDKGQLFFVISGICRNQKNSKYSEYRKNTTFRSYEIQGCDDNNDIADYTFDESRFQYDDEDNDNERRFQLADEIFEDLTSVTYEEDRDIWFYNTLYLTFINANTTKIRFAKDLKLCRIYVGKIINDMNEKYRRYIAIRENTDGIFVDETLNEFDNLKSLIDFINRYKDISNYKPKEIAKRIGLSEDLTKRLINNYHFND
jgi:hypothetical protein